MLNFTEFFGNMIKFWPTNSDIGLYSINITLALASDTKQNTSYELKVRVKQNDLNAKLHNLTLLQNKSAHSLTLRIVKIDHNGKVTVEFNDTIWSPAHFWVYCEASTFKFKIIDYFINN